MPYSGIIRWLNTEYGRCDDKVQVEKYMKALSLPKIRPPRMVVGKMFVKDEGYFKEFSLKPRVVMEVQDLRCVTPIAPFVNAVAEAWHVRDNAVLPPCVWMSGQKPDFFHRWYDAHGRRFAHALENDFSEFESRLSIQALEHEFMVYANLGAPEYVLGFFRSQLRMKLVSDSVTFRRRAGRMSGVPNTSLGNSIINLNAHVHVLRSLGFEAGRDYSMLVNGDDNLLFCTQEVIAAADQLTAGFSRLGMKSVIIPRMQKDRAQFCSCTLAEDAQGRAWLLPNPVRTLVKMGKFSEGKNAGIMMLVDLLKDYSQRPQFELVHRFSRKCLDSMGYKYGVAESISHPDQPSRWVDDFITKVHFEADGSSIIVGDQVFLDCARSEGLIETPSEPNFDMRTPFLGRPPKVNWIQSYRRFRVKLLRWLSLDYVDPPRRDEKLGTPGSIIHDEF